MDEFNQSAFQILKFLRNNRLNFCTKKIVPKANRRLVAFGILACRPSAAAGFETNGYSVPG